MKSAEKGKSKDRRSIKVVIPKMVASELQKRREIVFAYLFGSAVEGGFFNDVDVGVYVTGNQHPSLDYSIQLALFLERKLGKKVDVVIINTAPDHLIYEISKGMLLKNDDDDLRVDFVTNSWSRYLDFRQKRAEFIKEAFAKWGGWTFLGWAVLEKSSMMQLNKERIITLVGIAREAMGKLENYHEIRDEKLLKSSEKLSAIKYQFIVLIESCIDICNHISAKLYSKVPESYAGCFDTLAQNKVIGKKLAMKMGELAKFRNVLVHLYWKVDDAEVVRKLLDISQVEDFLREVSKLAAWTE